MKVTQEIERPEGMSDSSFEALLKKQLEDLKKPEKRQEPGDVYVSPGCRDIRVVLKNKEGEKGTHYVHLGPSPLAAGHVFKADPARTNAKNVGPVTTALMLREEHENITKTQSEVIKELDLLVRAERKNLAEALHRNAELERALCPSTPTPAVGQVYEHEKTHARILLAEKGRMVILEESKEGRPIPAGEFNGGVWPNALDGWEYLGLFKDIYRR